MPTYLAINATKIASVPSQKANPGQVKGEVCFAYDEYTSLTALVAADIINTGIIIPAGAKVKTVTVVSPTLGGTMSVGITGSTVKYVNAAVTAATTSVYPLIDAAIDDSLIITLGGATAAGVYKIAVEFIKA